MNTDQAADLLRTLRPVLPTIDTSLGRRDGSAYLRMSLAAAPSTWVIVATPGDRWFSVDTDGGFSVDHFEEEATDHEVEGTLRRLVQVGVAYLDGDYEVVRSRWLGLRALRVHVGSDHIEMYRSLTKSLRTLFRPSRA